VSSRSPVRLRSCTHVCLESSLCTLPVFPYLYRGIRAYITVVSSLIGPDTCRPRAAHNARPVHEVTCVFEPGTSQRAGCEAGAQAPQPTGGGGVISISIYLYMYLSISDAILVSTDVATFIGSLMCGLQSFF